MIEFMTSYGVRVQASIDNKDRIVFKRALKDGGHATFCFMHERGEIEMLREFARYLLIQKEHYPGGTPF